MATLAGDTSSLPWADQVKGLVRRRYTYLAEADAFPPGGAARAGEAGYPKDWLDGLPERVAGAYSGCGYALEGVDLSGVRVAVDLGCGAGLDVRLLAARLPHDALVVALDLAPSMLERARDAADPGDGTVGFLAADMEQLPLAGASADLVLANASFNLAVDKAAAFAEAARILRPGGRLVARDLVRDGPLPVEIAQNSAAWNTSLGGVLEQDDLQEALRVAGFVDIRISHHRPFSAVIAVRVQALRPNAEQQPVRAP
jgi:SAM-dependent methyltransferase